MRRNPALFGIPFVVLMLGASYGLSYFTQTKYELQDQRVSAVRLRCGILHSPRAQLYGIAGEQGAGAGSEEEP